MNRTFTHPIAVSAEERVELDVGGIIVRLPMATSVRRIAEIAVALRNVP